MSENQIKKFVLPPLALNSGSFISGKSLSPCSKSSNGSIRNINFPKKNKCDLDISKIEKKNESLDSIETSQSSPEIKNTKQNGIKINSNLRIRDGSPNRGKRIIVNSSQKLLKSRSPDVKTIQEPINFSDEKVLSLIQNKIQEICMNKGSFFSVFEKQKYVKLFLREVCQISIDKIDIVNTTAFLNIVQFIEASFKAFSQKKTVEEKNMKERMYDLEQQVRDELEIIENLSSENQKLCFQLEKNQIEEQLLSNLKLQNQQLLQQQKLAVFEGSQSIKKQNEEILEKVNNLSNMAKEQSEENQQIKKELLCLIRQYEIKKGGLQKSIVQLENNLLEYNEEQQRNLSQYSNLLNFSANSVDRVWVKWDDVQQYFILIKSISKIINRQFQSQNEIDITAYPFQVQFSQYLEKFEEGINEIIGI